MALVHVTKLTSLSGHIDCVYTLEPADKPELFFSGAGDGMIVLWDLTNPENGELIARLPNSIYALHHHKTSELLLAGHNYDGVHVLDWKEKKEVRSLKLGNAAIFDITSHGNDIFVASGDGSITIISASDWSIKEKITTTDKSARTIAVNPANREFAVGYSDHRIRVFGLEQYELRNDWQAHENSVFALSYDPTYKTLLSGSRDARLKQWDVQTSYTLKDEVPAHLYAINDLAFSPDAKHFVTCSLDKSIKVWRAGEIKLLKVIDKARHAGHGTSVNKLLWTDFGNILVSASDDRTISVWDLTFDTK